MKELLQIWGHIKFSYIRYTKTKENELKRFITTDTYTISFSLKKINHKLYGILWLLNSSSFHRRFSNFKNDRYFVYSDLNKFLNQTLRSVFILGVWIDLVLERKGKEGIDIPRLKVYKY